MQKRIRLIFILLVIFLLLSACTGGENAPNPGNQAAAQNEEIEAPPTGEESEPEVVYDEPYEITGGFEYSNSIITDYYVEHAVALLDMHAFVVRDEEWEMPVTSQTLGFLDIDMEAMTAQYWLQLPVQPAGILNDVDHDSKEETGVQVFAVGYNPNLYGGPYSEGDDASIGWPSYLASVIADTENQDEIIGGKLVVWSPDEAQEFPTGFGEDGLLFTEDDPVGPILPGYTIVDLDRAPFEFIKEHQPVLTLYEPKDIAVKDFSEDSYTGAFQKMFDIISVEYAFNGIEGKAPDWDALYSEIYPRIEQAEADNDLAAYVFALRDFTWAFKDGHVGLGGGGDLLNEAFTNDTDGGYGFAIRELDDGRVIVIYLQEGGPAEAAGIELGAEITGFNGKPISEAIAETKTWTLPTSSDFDLRYQQSRYLLADPVGTEIEVAFVNPEGQPQTASLTAISERDSFAFTSVYKGVNFDYMLPVDFSLIEEGNAKIGYIRMNSNYDDLNLIIRLFERALQAFEFYEVEGIIIDMRVNSGGANLGLAGLLTDQEIPMGQLEYYSEASGQFEPEGLPERVLPNQNQYRFNKMVTLVASTCASACELESYAFSQVPGMIVVGLTPTAGVEAEVARGQFSMPDDLFLQFPTGRFTLEDGSIFLEGQGVQPTLKVPMDETTSFAEGDVVLEYGIKAVLEPLGAGITPEHGPEMETRLKAAESALLGGAAFMEDEARESYSEEQLAEPGTFTYTVSLNQEDKVAWVYGWCASPDKLAENMSAIDLTFSLEGEIVPLEQMHVFDYPVDETMSCQFIYQILSDFAPGEHHLSTLATFTRPIDDGTSVYPAGDWLNEYTVYVSP
ncbi:MAG: PDZ domain-containing protein [Anaerolineales bacterium]|nr:PDZ domain-containing protein [Anaerolineales bacterium]